MGDPWNREGDGALELVSRGDRWAMEGLICRDGEGESPMRAVRGDKQRCADSCRWVTLIKETAQGGESPLPDLMSRISREPNA